MAVSVRHNLSIPSFAAPLALQLETSVQGVAAKSESIRDYEGREGIDIGRYGAIILARKISETPAKLLVLKEVQLCSDTSDEDENPTSDYSQPSGHLKPPFDSTREISIHLGLSRSLPHGQNNAENIVRALGLVSGIASGPNQQVHEIYLSLEYCPATLADVIDEYADRGVRLGLDRVKRFSRDLLSGLAWVHAQGVVHRDVTPGNLFISDQKVLKLADFGEARACGSRKYPSDQFAVTKVHTDAGVDREWDTKSFHCTTIWWRAPEVCLGFLADGFPVDMWAAGCVLGEMLLLEPVFMADGDFDMLNVMVKLLGPPELRYLNHLQPAFDSANEADSFGSPRQIDIPNFEKFVASQRDAVAAHLDSSTRSGSLRLKFERHGGQQTVDMLTALLHWDPLQRLTAKQALQGAYTDGETNTDGDASSNKNTEPRPVPDVEPNSVIPAAWWRKSPRADDKPSSSSFHRDEMLLSSLLERKRGRVG